jgi:hypothetical protein
LSVFAHSSRPRLLLAALFAIATAVYCGIWIHYIQVLPQSVVGVAFRPFSPERKSLYLVRVAPGSPAERADLRPGDRIVEINGRPLDNLDPWVDLVLKGKPVPRSRSLESTAPAAACGGKSKFPFCPSNWSGRRRTRTPSCDRFSPILCSFSPK